ncbi:SRPBCC domain-containing protein [Streptomyces caniscabiei]|uniref:Carbon monoxide dehydrogenase n=1 Tax=Streptomyces caniscabiei TaxID=2746961 RepID=A0A927L899_9ACTN|nr:SRPBCC family protein [Streptomyces caniscabiei]MBD9725874.1 carbon monoxide dehydrogenase [Streptomyces caniscabiei]MDX3507587.1 SRPBCC domain-containing protein [Streptomyces caniscabiei]MDX3717549.1 SRPBCC domain-containing protein [Streptomyces caniscabiei]WEO25302.1 SRPBCC domain-containing protein [Streptomyces caniscabiei]
MEHEVFVPVPVGRLREALSDPERVARAVPGLQQDAGTPPVAGRLKVRVAGHTITYRGTLRVSPQDDGSYVVDGDAAEVRGSGTVKLTLTLRLVPTAEGTTLTCSASATATGRITDLPPDPVTSAATRLLERFTENLTARPEPEPHEGTTERNERDRPSAAAPKNEPPASTEEEPSPSAEEEPQVPAEEDPRVSAEGESRTAADEEPPAAAEDESAASVFETDVPPSALDPFGEGGFAAGDEPPAEAAHARRTMIGRSAEEVDHAPPRGRYAPVPAPETVSASATLRWAAPAAALAVASAIIVSRALRKRR